MKQTVKSECSSCCATGIYRGSAEPDGVGVVCLDCDGSGCKEICYTPFNERKIRTDVKTVYPSRGCLFATGVGPAGTGMSYEDFSRGVSP